MTQKQLTSGVRSEEAVDPVAVHPSVITDPSCLVECGLQGSYPPPRLLPLGKLREETGGRIMIQSFSKQQATV